MISIAVCSVSSGCSIVHVIEFVNQGNTLSNSRRSQPTAILRAVNNRRIQGVQ